LDREVKIKTLPCDTRYNAACWADAQHLFLARDYTSRTPMQQYWLSHPKDGDGHEIDEDGMIEMDDAIVESHHDAGFPIEWEESSSLTHPEADVEVSKRRKPSEHIVNSIAKMVMAIRDKSLSEDTLLARYLPLCGSVKAWVLCPSERNNYGWGGAKLSRDQELSRFVEEVGRIYRSEKKSKHDIMVLFHQIATVVKKEAAACSTNKQVKESEAVDKRWYPDLYAMSGPPRAWETMPFTWKEMWTYDWGHKIHFFKKNHPWNAEWQASPYNKNPATTPTKGPASKRPAHESGAQIVVSQYASKHSAIIGVYQPCHADTCDVFTCVNSMMIHYTTYKEAVWLQDEGRARATNHDRWLGLYARREVPPNKSVRVVHARTHQCNVGLDKFCSATTSLVGV